MQLLVVHRDPEVGEGLSAMVREYTPHTAAFVGSDEEARAWLEQNNVCDLLLTQVEAAGIDGLSLASSLGENPGPVRFFFLPNYPRSAQRLEVTQTKIFPEPIDGESLLQAIAQAGELQDFPRSFHIVDVLQMFCLSGNTGAVELFLRGETGVVFLREGSLRHAVFADTMGLDAICEMVARGPAAFSFDANASAPRDTIEGDWESALIEAVMRKRAARSLEEAIAPEAAAAPLPNEPDYVGLRFADYKIGRKLSQTSSSVLYQAEQLSIGRQVVLHILRPHMRALPEARQEFLDFASVNANIRHPSILPVYESGEENGVDFFAREFVMGRTLEEIREGGLTISALVALRVIRAIADSFAHLEGHGILHAPIDLSRIFVKPNEEVQLAEIAVANPAQAQSAPARFEIRKLGRLLIPLTKAAAVPGAGRVLKLIHQMQTTGEDAITEWSALAQEAKTLEAILAPPPVFSPRKTGLLDKVKFWGKAG